MPDQIRDTAEIVIAIVGLVLIIVAAAALVLNLIGDILKVFRQNTTFAPQSLGDWLEKLPERYFVPTVLLLLGILLADPDLFARYSGAIFGQASGAGS